MFYNKFMKKENSQIRLKKIMNDRGLRQVDILEKSKPFQDKLGIKMSKTHLSNYINKISAVYTLKMQKNMFPLFTWPVPSSYGNRLPVKCLSRQKRRKSGVPPSVLFQHSTRVRSADYPALGGATEIRTFRA